MANYPQLDDARGIWNLREVYDAVMGGYWPNANAIAVFNHGRTGGSLIEKITMSTTGNATVFGDATLSKVYIGNNGIGSFTRGVFAEGSPGGNVDTIDYITFSTDGNAADFGNLSQARGTAGSGSNSVRGITGGGQNSSTDRDWETVM